MEKSNTIAIKNDSNNTITFDDNAILELLFIIRQTSNIAGDVYNNTYNKNQSAKLSTRLTQINNSKLIMSHRNNRHYQLKPN